MPQPLVFVHTGAIGEESSGLKATRQSGAYLHLVNDAAVYVKGGRHQFSQRDVLFEGTPKIVRLKTPA